MGGLDTYTEGLGGPQKSAFDGIVQFLTMGGGGFYLLSGYAGTGKTFLMGRVLQYIQQTSQRPVALTCPTHKALKVLMHHTQAKDLYTTHAYLGMREEIDINGNQIFRKPKTFAKPPPCENYMITIVDEASMVADEIFDELEYMVTSGHKVIFVGDPMQIPPINYTDSLPFMRSVQRDLSFHTGHLDEIIRQVAGNPIIATSMEIRNNISSPIPALSYQNHTEGLLGVRYAEKRASKELMQDILDMFASSYFKIDPDYVKIIAWTNDEVDKYNKKVREHLFGKGLPNIIVGDKLTANAPFMEGTQYLVKNNEDMEVLEVEVIDDQLSPTETLQVNRALVKVFGMKGESREAVIRIIHEESEAYFNKRLEDLKTLAKVEKKGTYQSKSRWIDYYKLKERYANVKYGYAITAHKSQGSTYDHAVILLYDMLHNNRTVERNRILYTAVTRPKYTLRIIY